MLEKVTCSEKNMGSERNVGCSEKREGEGGFSRKRSASTRTPFKGLREGAVSKKKPFKKA